jgi:serine/threonine-protein kinase
VVQVGTVVGRYRVVRMLASGGMGSVFEAVQVDLPRRVAIKVMHPELGADGVSAERFEREARAAASLGHPNIVQVQDFGRTGDGEPFLVMEYLEGRTLMEVLMAETRLSAERVVSIFSQLLAALDATHRVGIVHRDLKASNVFLVPIAGGELVKVLDFGVAKIIESEAHKKLTSTGVIVGTPQYMPPEQMRGEDVDERADIYCTGVMMFMSLAGRRPFEGDGAELTRQVILVGAPPLGRIAPHVPGSIAAIVDKALARDRRGRFASAADMLDALRRTSIPPQPVAAPVPQQALPLASAMATVPERNSDDAVTRRSEGPPARPYGRPEIALPATEPRPVPAIGAARRPPAWNEAAIPPTSAPPPVLARMRGPARSRSGLGWALGVAALVFVLAACILVALGLYRKERIRDSFRDPPPPEVDRGAVLPPPSADPPDDVYVTGYEGPFDRYEIIARFDRHGARWLGCFGEASPRVIDGRRTHLGLWEWRITVEKTGRGRVVSHDPGEDPLPGLDACMRSLVEDMEFPRPPAPSTFMVRMAVTWDEG